MDINALIRRVPDYPQPGILFYDITPLLASAEGFAHVTDWMVAAARPLRPTMIVAAEARGFLFAAPLAQRLGIGLAPVRKPGKLPCATLSISYALEYGTSTLCLHKDALRPDDRVLIVDDVLATGGTARAMAHLVRQSGASVAGCCMLMELDALNGRQALDGIPLSVLLHV
ncbi:adenine phosphoribosyltransferase [uncultured Desulfovibrio sp.]|uniref:adenine phosphoribosyltransferase n=1 Tax=uncultured Desulfovibrio sp. TaxID=167968 RepID=UPI002623134E|nr:adenine phosphoribosyltransferase [uncultured Desulfovibrio sp.]